MFHVFLTGFILTFGGFPGPQSSLDISADTTETRWALVSQESEARYRVQEQLAGFDLPNDAVGATRNVTGTISFAPDGSLVPGGSEIRVQLSSLTTDNERRDGYVRRRTLEVEEYPEAVLVPLRFVDLPDPIPLSGSATFLLEADLSLHGETRQTIWEVTADFGPETLTGFATTAFPFHTFGIAVPQVARVLSVENTIRLELDFQFRKEAG